jgi:hypothetical protein
MPHTPDDITLADRYYVTLIVRLTLGRRGQLIQGELVDTTDTVQQRFIGTSGLRQAMENWLQQQEAAEDHQNT